MPFTVVLADADADAALLDAIFADVRRVDRVFSPFIQDSAVSRLRDGALREEDASSEVAEVLALCRRFQEETEGYFSAWATGALDPCGLVKGWAIRRACDALDRAGHRSYFVDGGGDVFARGDRGAGEPWRVGVRHPVARDRVATVLRVIDLAVATSGSYEKGQHIVDPHTGAPASELVSITVVGPDIVAADAYATAAFAMGRRGLEFVDAIPGYSAMAIDVELYAASTPAFDRLVI